MPIRTHGGAMHWGVLIFVRNCANGSTEMLQIRVSMVVHIVLLDLFSMHAWPQLIFYEQYTARRRIRTVSLLPSPHHAAAAITAVWWAITRTVQSPHLWDILYTHQCTVHERLWVHDLRNSSVIKATDDLDNEMDGLVATSGTRSGQKRSQVHVGQANTARLDHHSGIWSAGGRGSSGAHRQVIRYVASSRYIYVSYRHADEIITWSRKPSCPAGRPA